MQNFNNLFMTIFLNAIFGVFARVLNSFENMNIGMNLKFAVVSLDNTKEAAERNSRQAGATQ